ncbi:ThuA domain-containing protein [Plantibacter flavus]
MLIATGTGRYSDPWHPLETTTQLIANAFAEAGDEVETTDQVDEALTRLADVDVLVVNAADPWRNGETGRGQAPGAADGLSAALARGIGILSIHNAVSSLRDYPEWRAAIGGAWVPGRSGHPELGPATITVTDEDHDVTSGIETFELVDERYSDLDIDHDVHVLLSHRIDDRVQPAAWTREHLQSRIVVSTLGHDPRSFESPEHRRFLVQAAHWAHECSGTR